MKVRNRVIEICCLLCGLIVVVCLGSKGFTAQSGDMAGMAVPLHTIRIWYADEALSNYVNKVAIAYGEEHHVRVIPELKSGLEYLEEINAASLDPSIPMPDLYITSNDMLGKAYLAGLACEVQDTKGICTALNYPETAIQAVTYQDKIIGYPFYYETAMLLYNKTYMPDTIPNTMEDILTLADEYDPPETVEAVFKWDVSDIFYNYFFVGNYMNVGGTAGDDIHTIDIYNQNTIDSLRIYQNLNQFFSIDTKEVTYDSVLQEFLDGKIVFSVVTTDAIAKIEQAKADGTFPYEYEIASLPNLNATLKTKGLSVTNAVVVNGYSTQKAAANEFAKYLVCNHIEDLYPQTGKVAAQLKVSYENPKVAQVMNEYQCSVPMPKMIETSNFWVQLEIAFTKIWTGEDVEVQLKQLSDQIMKQVTGESSITPAT
ncbi:MAG: extracellular solute-binding protein [Lachnospiraceae bacterium]